jgi:hypothetical protein
MLRIEEIMQDGMGALVKEWILSSLLIRWKIQNGTLPFDKEKKRRALDFDKLIRLKTGNELLTIYSIFYRQPRRKTVPEHNSFAQQWFI